MVAINQSFSILVHRYATPGCRGLPVDDNIWNSFPFNNGRFCALAGIEVGAGLSRPPHGILGDRLGTATRRHWSSKAKELTNFLTYCDNERRRYGDEVTIETFQRDVLKDAPSRAAWEWAVDTLFKIPGGMNDKLCALARDHGCDAEEAYRAAREEAVSIPPGFLCVHLLTSIDQMHELGEAFQEHKVNGMKFNEVFLPARMALARAVYGDPDGNGRPHSSWYPTLRAMMYRPFVKQARRLAKHAANIEDLEKQVKKAYESKLDRSHTLPIRPDMQLSG
jgi:hypothetical protein